MPRKQRPTCGGCRLRIVHFLCNDPDRCPRCWEPGFNARVTLGSMKCKCDQPRMPSKDKNGKPIVQPDRPTPAVRYGN